VGKRTRGWAKARSKMVKPPQRVMLRVTGGNTIQKNLYRRNGRPGGGGRKHSEVVIGDLKMICTRGAGARVEMRLINGEPMKGWRKIREKKDNSLSSLEPKRCFTDKKRNRGGDGQRIRGKVEIYSCQKSGGEKDAT